MGIIPPLFFKNKMQTLSNIEITEHTAPADWGLSLASAKLHLNILDTSFDTIISEYIAAAHTFLFQETNILIKGKLKGSLHFWDVTRLQFGLIESIDVKYFDKTNTLQTIDPQDYYLTLGKYGMLEPKTEIETSERIYPVEVEITTKANDNELITQALRMIVADLFESRQTNVMGSHTELSRTTRYQLDLISLRTFV